MTTVASSKSDTLQKLEDGGNSTADEDVAEGFPTEEDEGGEHVHRHFARDAYILNFEEYRRIISASFLEYESDFFPNSKYKAAWLSYDERGEGSTDIHDLNQLLWMLGQPASQDEVSHMLEEFDRGDGRLLFDDFVELMGRLVNTTAELELLDKIEDKGHKLQMELVELIIRVVSFILFVTGYFLNAIFNMIIGEYSTF